jgi:hypothetical protein
VDLDELLERLEPELTERDGDELLEPELDLVTLAGLLDLVLTEGLERVMDALLEPELELVILLERLEVERVPEYILLLFFEEEVEYDFFEEDLVVVLEVPTEDLLVR